MIRHSPAESAGLGILAWACGSVLLALVSLLGLTGCENGSDTYRDDSPVAEEDAAGTTYSWVWESWSE